MGNACVGSRQIKKGLGDEISNVVLYSESPHDSITANRVSDINGRPVYEIPPAATNNKPPRQVIMRLNFTIPDQFPELFSLGRRIGQGRFGTVYLCVENSTGKEYACKLIEKRKLVKDDDLSDLAREIQIMYHLAGHSNVASIKEAYEDSETVRIVMELCKGGQLLDRIKRQGNFAERKAAEIISTIVGVVEYIHSLGVMHRDLKPENFLFVNDQDDSLLKAIDFGLSTFFEPGEKFGDIVGSPYYVAPEVLRRNYGPEADIWSAGVILYILLSGRPPFWEKTEENIFNQVLHGELDLSSDPWPFISENAKDLVRRMIERNPVSRISAIQVLCHPWIMLNSIDLDRPLDCAGFDSIDAYFHLKSQLNGT